VLVGRQHLDDEILEDAEIFRRAAQQEVAVAGDHPGLPHDRPRLRPRGKGFQVRVGLPLQADHAEGDEIEAELRPVEERMIALDDPGFFELAHAAQAGRRGDADPLCEFDVRHAPVLLQFPQNFDVYGVQIGAKHGLPLQFSEPISQKRVERKQTGQPIHGLAATVLLLMQGCP